MATVMWSNWIFIATKETIFATRTCHIVKPNASISLTKISTASGWTTCKILNEFYKTYIENLFTWFGVVAQLVTSNSSIYRTPLVITYSSPLTVITHFNTTLSSVCIPTSVSNFSNATSSTCSTTYSNWYYCKCFKIVILLGQTTPATSL